MRATIRPGEPPSKMAEGHSVRPAIAAWLGGIALLVYSREFPGPDGPASAIYSNIPDAYGARWIDVGMIFLTYLLAFPSFARHRGRPFVPRGMRRALGLFGVSVLISALYGYLRGGTELFYEWRNLALGTCAGYITYRLVRPGDAVMAAWWLFLLLGGRAAVLLLLWAAGALRIPPFGGPVWDGPTISSAVAASSLGLGFLIDRTVRYRSLSLIFTSASVIVVVAALRRTYWAELAVMMSVLLICARYKRAVQIAVVTVALSITLAFLPGELILLRVESLARPLDFANPLASTNQFHVEDVLIAWRVLHQSPVFGVGQGLPIETEGTAWGRAETWGIHNGPLHVWLRFGLLGLIAYLWFHVAGFRWLFGMAAASRARGVPLAVAAYWVGTFVPSLGFSPWAYGALQNSILIAVLLGIAARWFQHQPLFAGTLGRATAWRGP